MTNNGEIEHLKKLKHGLFATRDNSSEGFNYAYDLIDTLPKKHRISAYTALHVATNSIAEETIKLIETRS